MFTVLNEPVALAVMGPMWRATSDPRRRPIRNRRGPICPIPHIGKEPFNAEIRGRKIGDTFFDRRSSFPAFFRGSPRGLSLVFPLM
jgi:hypothetical protein